MLSAIHSSASRSVLPAKKSTADLEAQLSKSQKTLADCITCPSSKTPEGKRNIQEISLNISGLQKQIKEKELNAAAQPTTHSPEMQYLDPNEHQTSLGRQLNVFA